MLPVGELIVEFSRHRRPHNNKWNNFRRLSHVSTVHVNRYETARHTWSLAWSVYTYVYEMEDPKMDSEN